jgi:hypothetical protein
MTDQAVAPDKQLTTAKLAGAGDSATRPAAAPAEARKSAEDDRSAPLLAKDEAQGFRSRWGEIQAGFVDEPRRAVEEADGLVAGAMKRLAEVFASERSNLEGQWDRGDDVSTEDLRQALRRYRAFFDRLLSV